MGNVSFSRGLIILLQVIKIVNIDKDLFLQKETQNKIKTEFGTGLWVDVFYIEENEMNEITFWGYLVPNNLIDKSLEETEWDLHVGHGLPGCFGNSAGVEYHRFGDDDGIEPLVFYREFRGDNESYVEVSEEFRLFHNLYHDTDTNIYYKIDESGNEDPVIKIEGMNVKIKLKYLKQFLAIKEMHFALGFEIDQFSDKSLGDMGLEDSTSSFKFDKIRYDIHLMNSHVFEGDAKPALSRLVGKKLIPGVVKENSGLWPYNKKRKYEDFIYKVDKDGEDVFFTCNPKELANNFGANPDAPHYLTPILFNREVLEKYYAKSSLYSVEDGKIFAKGLWSLRVDNHNPDYVIVYLGDLGRDIHYPEQKHWKNFNIAPDGKLSKVKFERDFEGKWTDAEISDLKFKAIFRRFNELWYKKYGWKLFLNLSEKDQHHFVSLRIPLNKEQSEFDSQISSLVKIIIDSLNEKEIIKLTKSDTEGISGSISKLELFLKDRKVQNHDKHIKFLRNLQDLRSTGVAHRKGKKYKKVSKYFVIADKNLSEVFDQILGDVISFLEFMKSEFLD